MAPISLATLGEFASQLSQEFGDRDSEIFRLEAENARLRALEGENARLRTLLEHAAASKTSHNTTTTATPVIEFRTINTEDRQQSEDALVDEACDVTGVDGARYPSFPGIASGRLNGNRRTANPRHCQNPSSDDDEDPIPVPKKERIPVTAATENASLHLAATVTAGARKRKRVAESADSFSSRLSESLDGLVVGESSARSEGPLRSVHSTSQQESGTRPAKRSRRCGSTAAAARPRQPPVGQVQTPTKKHTHAPHAYTPLQKPPFGTPPPAPRKQQQSSNFAYPGSSNTTRLSPPKWPKRKNQPQPSSHTTKEASSNTATGPTSPTYAEITPFTFKFIISYDTPPSSPDGEPPFEFHDSAFMTNTMSSFWKALATLREKWEDQAGVEWAWEVQKKVKTRRSASGGESFERVCVTSKLDNKRTRWRPMDTGFFACLECALAARPCFTWVKYEDTGDEEGEDQDQVFGAPKGEFRCLPVHKDDRRREDVPDREIRTWIDGGESSGDEESEEREFDACDDDDSEFTSGESSEESSAEDRGGENSDGEL
jgi:hypothetical protein